MKILLDNISIITMQEDNHFIEKGYVSIEGNIIKEVNSGSAPAGSWDKIIDGHERVAMPGFINTHTHAAMTLLRSYADDLPLMEWLETKIWPLEERLAAEDIYWGTMLAIVEMIKSGTTTFADMYMFEDEVARAVSESGIRAVLARGMVGIGPENERAIIESRELANKWHQANNGKIRIMLGPHAPYTCPPQYLARVMDLAGELGVGIHIHVAETITELNNIKKEYGKTPVQHLADLGLFDHHVLAAHCVHINTDDIRILKQGGAGIAHNPESNMKLASGIAPVPLMLAAGIPVALGTDGASSNNNLDMLQEMRTCALLHKVNSMDPMVLPAYQALRMATANGAAALGMDEEVGQIKPGMKADLILLKLDEAHMIPCYDIAANIVYAAQASDVDTVIIDGRVVMENRKITLFDEAEVLSNSRRVAKRLVGE